MISEINIEKYLKSADELPLIDVRSPKEFMKGHIPGAYNIPLFSDEERSVVGTLFKNQSQEEAIKAGYEFVKPKLSDFIKKSKELAPQNKVAIYCWRGGIRSHAFAMHLDANGFTEVYLIIGGYKVFRSHVLGSFDKNVMLYVIGGYTGSGKTMILKYFKKSGIQVIDLEGLANHRGSAFGAVENSFQPTTEQFENNLFMQWDKMDFSKPVWIEDESHKIGSVSIPMNLYKKMNESTICFVEIPKEERARYLVKEYANCDKTILADALLKISRRLGDLNTKKAIECLKNENFYEVAMLALGYYDKAYCEALSHRDQKFVYHIKLNDTNHQKNAEYFMNKCLDFFPSDI